MNVFVSFVDGMLVRAVSASTEGTASQSGAEELWSEEKTLFLIDAYEYLRIMGKRMLTKRQMWESLAEKINDVFQGTVTASQGKQMEGPGATSFYLLLLLFHCMVLIRVADPSTKYTQPHH